MTYCVGIKLKAGLVFLSDSRTNAGLDQISTFRKMIVYEKTDDRFMVLLSAGNLSISQSVREILQIEQIKDTPESEPITIWNAKSMFDAVRVLGAAIRRVHERDAAEVGGSRVSGEVADDAAEHEAHDQGCTGEYCARVTESDRAMERVHLLGKVAQHEHGCRNGKGLDDELPFGHEETPGGSVASVLHKLNEHTASVFRVDEVYP